MSSHESSPPRRTLGLLDAMSLVVGIVVGSGIFFMPSLVAQNASSPLVLIGLWLAGGLMALVGALCYAELATAYPDTGGDYSFLRRAYGPSAAFLFGWGRMTVIQTGALAAAALIGGNYISDLVPASGRYGAELWAGTIVLLFTVVNMCGLRFGRFTQNGLTLSVTAGLLLVVLAGAWLALAPTTGQPAGAGGLVTGTEPPAASPQPLDLRQVGLAMIFVLYTFGGWNEAAYVSAEVREPPSNIAWALLLGVGGVTVIYLAVNVALLAGLGLEAMAASRVVAADLLRQAAGPWGATLVTALVVLAVLSTVNATIITGGRSNYVLGRDFPAVLGALQHWNSEHSVPLPALALQGAVSLLLIAIVPWAFGAGGVEAMVAYTAPVFWLFFALSGLSVIVLRWRDPDRPRPFRTPHYPAVPLLFSLICLSMSYSAIRYAGAGSLLGLVVLLSGVPVMLGNQRLTSRGRPD